MDEAEKVYKMWHKFPPKNIKSVDLPDPKGTLRLLGMMTRLDYRSDKWGREPVYYYHHFRKNPPMLAQDGKGNYFILGNIRVTPAGIDDWLTKQSAKALRELEPYVKKVTKLGVLEMIEYLDEERKKRAITFGDRFYVAHPNKRWTYITAPTNVQGSVEENPAFMFGVKQWKCPSCQFITGYVPVSHIKRIICPKCKKEFTLEENSRMFPWPIYVWQQRGQPVRGVRAEMIWPEEQWVGLVDVEGYRFAKGPRGGWRWQHPQDPSRYVPHGERAQSYDAIFLSDQTPEMQAAIRRNIEERKARLRQHPPQENKGKEVETQVVVSGPRDKLDEFMAEFTSPDPQMEAAPRIRRHGKWKRYYAGRVLMFSVKRVPAKRGRPGKIVLLFTNTGIGGTTHAADIAQRLELVCESTGYRVNPVYKLPKHEKGSMMQTVTSIAATRLATIKSEYDTWLAREGSAITSLMRKPGKFKANPTDVSNKEVQLTAAEEAAWNYAYEYYASNENLSEGEVRAKAWKDVQTEFPRLMGYAGGITDYGSVP